MLEFVNQSTERWGHPLKIETDQNPNLIREVPQQRASSPTRLYFVPCDWLALLALINPTNQASESVPISMWKRITVAICSADSCPSLALLVLPGQWIEQKSGADADGQVDGVVASGPQEP